MNQSLSLPYLDSASRRSAALGYVSFTILLFSSRTRYLHWLETIIGPSSITTSNQHPVPIHEIISLAPKRTRGARSDLLYSGKHCQHTAISEVCTTSDSNVDDTRSIVRCTGPMGGLHNTCPCWWYRDQAVLCTEKQQSLTMNHTGFCDNQHQPASTHLSRLCTL